MITVFIPHRKNDNIYLEEIIQFSECNYLYGDYRNVVEGCSIVNIQFPEAIFDWEIPTIDDLTDLEDHLIQWKVKMKIVYTMNDLKKHNSKNVMFDRLFKLVHKYSDGVIHLGDYSLNTYKYLFPSECKHKVVYHSLYNSLKDKYSNYDIKDVIPIELNEKFVVTSIGGIRSKKEMKLILKIFKNIPYNNKVLVVPKMNQFYKIPKFVPCRFRKIYRFFFEYLSYFSIKNETYYFGDKFIEYPYIVDLLRKTSLYVIPRLDNLNSGNLFLGITFEKKMIVPAVGNMKEILELLNLPIFDFQKNNKINLKKFLCDLSSYSYSNNQSYNKNKQLFFPDKIAKATDDFFVSISNKE